jgi:hypothetical protein
LGKSMFALGDRCNGSRSHRTMSAQIEEAKRTDEPRQRYAARTHLNDPDIAEYLHQATRECLRNVFRPRGIVDRTLGVFGRCAVRPVSPMMVEAFQRSERAKRQRRRRPPRRVEDPNELASTRNIPKARVHRPFRRRRIELHHLNRYPPSEPKRQLGRSAQSSGMPVVFRRQGSDLAA